MEAKAVQGTLKPEFQNKNCFAKKRLSPMSSVFHHMNDEILHFVVVHPSPKNNEVGQII